MSDEHNESSDVHFEDSLEHYGIIRKSGRYPWGSGKDPYQRSMQFYNLYEQMRKEGMSERQIAEGLGLYETEGLHKGKPSTSMLRATLSAAKNEKIKQNYEQVRALRQKQWSAEAISRETGIPASTVRSYLNNDTLQKRDTVQKTMSALKTELDQGGYLDVGLGTEQHIGVSRDKIKVALRLLKEEGYGVHHVAFGVGAGNTAVTTVLAPPGVDFKEVNSNRNDIRTIGQRFNRDTDSFETVHEPKSVKAKRMEVVYAEDGGADRDGLIELRPGAKDLDLGNKRYAQVRIAVDDSHYLKGMAVYNDDLPEGVDIRFHTNKKKGTPVLGTKDNSVLKPMKDDPSDRFGSQIKAGGQRGAINIVNEEGDWADWSSKLSSQMLSKQSVSLAKQQLNLTADAKRAELDEILSYNNPTVRQKLLKSFAEDVDAQAVRLKAMGLPGTKNHVIIPVPEMPANEIYAPGYQNGEKVVLIRHPHGGTFEIPELTVNNKRMKAKSILGQAPDAVGIHPRVAEQLSGADFDGDTVLVIPQRPESYIKNRPILEGLKGFEPKDEYKIPEGDKTTPRMTNTQLEMGKISNLITDMTIIGADDADLLRAVKHSMVVIDAEKHGLNYKLSEKENGIAALKKKYQGATNAGSSTLISRAKSPNRNVLDRRLRRAQDGGNINPETGELVYEETGKNFLKRSVTPKVRDELAEKLGRPAHEITKMVQAGLIDDPRVKEEIHYNTNSVAKLALTNDARTLMSNGGVGQPIERVYADHSNKLKALANEARKARYFTPNLKTNKDAKQEYKPEVESLVAKLNEAIRNKPLERNARMLAGVEVQLKKQENPFMDSDTRKKVEAKALQKARLRTGASKYDIEITDREWEAIQSGAISHDRLTQILDNTDMERVKALATPRTQRGVSSASTARAKAMLARGYSLAEVANALGISVSTVSNIKLGKV